MSERKSKPKDVDSYIAQSAIQARPKLQEVRELIQSTIPNVEEGISYGVPFYTYCGDLAGFAAYKNHVSFGFSAAVLQRHDRELLEAEGYKTGKRTVQIAFDRDVPVAAIKNILEAQAKLNAADRTA